MTATFVATVSLGAAHAQSANADATPVAEPISDSAKSSPVAVHNVVLVHGFHADVNSGHVPMLSQPQAVAHLIVKAANGQR
ncbi:hypothetical protein PV762_19355 [Mitsuaria sp. CC2]|uniref:hypothetical protein n=1 Tax=Mitsuaria sp. CC2 TaxID=3029186 RepID=UPI003B8B2336